MTFPSPMKSPDRDAADELLQNLTKRKTMEAPFARYCWQNSAQIIEALSELATLRRRVAKLETGVSEIARLPDHSPLDACAYQGGDIPKKFMREQAIYTPAFNNATERARSIARALLSPPTRKE